MSHEYQISFKEWKLLQLHKQHQFLMIIFVEHLVSTAVDASAVVFFSFSYVLVTYLLRNFNKKKDMNISFRKIIIVDHKNNWKLMFCYTTRINFIIIFFTSKDHLIIKLLFEQHQNNKLHRHTQFLFTCIFFYFKLNFNINIMMKWNFFF